MTMRYDHIAIEGLIGAGKTTLARRIAADRGARLVLEEFDENPFLPRFYEEPQRYAFAVELSFLAQRYHQLKRVTEQELFASGSVADYSLGKSLIFASVTLPKDELSLFLDLYRIMYGDLPRPDLIVYLHMSMERVRSRILSRGRSYEQRITAEYLEDLQRYYMDHLQKASGTRVLLVDIGDADLMQEPQAYAALQALLEKDHPMGFTVIQL